jgi:hypothetical protein
MEWEGESEDESEAQMLMMRQGRFGKIGKVLI